MATHWGNSLGHDQFPLFTGIFCDCSVGDLGATQHSHGHQGYRRPLCLEKGSPNWLDSLQNYDDPSRIQDGKEFLVCM